MVKGSWKNKREIFNMLGISEMVSNFIRSRMLFTN